MQVIPENLLSDNTSRFIAVRDDEGRTIAAGYVRGRLQDINYVLYIPFSSEEEGQLREKTAAFSPLPVGLKQAQNPHGVIAGFMGRHSPRLPYEWAVSARAFAVDGSIVVDCRASGGPCRKYTETCSGASSWVDYQEISAKECDRLAKKSKMPVRVHIYPTPDY